MLRWFVNLTLLVCVATAVAQDAPSYLLPGRLGAGQTLWTHDANAGKWHSQSIGLIDVQYAATTLLSGAECVTNRIAGSWTITDAGVATLLANAGGKRRIAGQGSWTVVGLFEDADDAGVVRRTRFVAAVGRTVQLSPTWGLRLALHGGRGSRRWGEQGIWDSQYVANPLDPASAGSGETPVLGVRSYLEGGFELGLIAPTVKLSYRLLHVPSNQSLLDASEDPYSSRHSFLGTVRKSVADQVEATGWAEFETQGGARLFTVGAAGAWTFGEDSYYTGFKAATLVSGGLVYRSTGHLSPLMHVAWKRRYMVWVAPDIPVGARAAASGLHIGLRARLE